MTDHVTPEDAREIVKNLRNLSEGYGDAKFAVAWIQVNRCDLADMLDSLAAQLEATQEKERQLMGLLRRVARGAETAVISVTLLEEIEAALDSTQTHGGSDG